MFIPQVANPAQVESVLRLLWHDVRDRGLPREYVADGAVSKPFPDLLWSDPVLGVAQSFLERTRIPLSAAGEMCDPQFIFHVPEQAPDDIVLKPHTDVEPEWANGRKYKRIVGVALSEWNRHNGGLHVWDDKGVRRAVRLSPGDAIVLTPDTRHSPGINRSAWPRIGIYFRWLHAA